MLTYIDAISARDTATSVLKTSEYELVVSDFGSLPSNTGEDTAVEHGCRSSIEESKLECNSKCFPRGLQGESKMIAENSVIYLYRVISICSAY
jgi:hypothetical protein